MLRPEKGFVFFTVLLFLQLMAMLSLYELQQAAYMIKISKRPLEHQYYYLLAEHVLDRIETSTLMRPSHCLIPIIPASQLRALPLTWWGRYACYGEISSIQYHYIIESLGADACAIVNGAMQADYYRLTIKLIANEKKFNLLLQRTIIVPSKAVNICQGSMHTVSLGRQSQREL